MSMNTQVVIEAGMGEMQQNGMPGQLITPRKRKNQEVPG
jgi:hypothetical protein